MKGYFAESENVFMFLMTYFFAIAKDIVLFTIYFKSLVLRFEIVSDKIFSVIPISTAFFRLSKYVTVVVLLSLIFSFFLTATNALATWIIVFFLFLIWFFHGRLMEINSTHVYFRSIMMLCFDDEKQKDKNTLTLFFMGGILPCQNFSFNIEKLRQAFGLPRFFSEQNLVLKVYWNFQVNSMPISTLMTILSGDVIQCFLKENNKNNKDKK